MSASCPLPCSRESGSIQLFTEKPPKGDPRSSASPPCKVGWMLTNTRNPQSWERFFLPGPRMFSALAATPISPGAYGWIAHWGPGLTLIAAPMPISGRSGGCVE
jgi:hypothetical protein